MLFCIPDCDKVLQRDDGQIWVYSLELPEQWALLLSAS
jgi:hypothetical protein